MLHYKERTQVQGTEIITSDREWLVNRQVQANLRSRWRSWITPVFWSYQSRVQAHASLFPSCSVQRWLHAYQGPAGHPRPLGWTSERASQLHQCTQSEFAGSTATVPIHFWFRRSVQLTWSHASCKRAQEQQGIRSWRHPCRNIQVRRPVLASQATPFHST